MKKTLVILSALLITSTALAREIAYCKIDGEKETVRMVLNDYGYARHVLKGNLNFYVSTESLPVVDVGIDENTSNPQAFKMLADKKGSVDHFPISVSVEGTPGVDCWVDVPSFRGRFALNHEVGFMNYEDAAACSKDKMIWKDGICVSSGDDSVEVSAPDGNLNVDIETVTTNAHTCSFSGKAKIVSYTQLLASSPAQVYDRSTRTFHDGTCEVTLTFTPNHNTVTTTTNGMCDDMCGMNATLEVEKAVRKKTSL